MSKVDSSVGVDHVGPYQIGAAFVSQTHPDGELPAYYDNPEFVPEDSLRSFMSEGLGHRRIGSNRSSGFDW